ncbi:heme binding protein, putative [Ricinus communis]|uniref:Heme binding protein, putative n=1 Tax=Ricinus communis TaxID=3988 RepID=B9SJY2_RICCO|nr:heme binding protein, putative [Ricinus communis]
MVPLACYLQLILTAVFFSFFICLFKSNKNGLPRNWPFLGMSPMFILINLRRLPDKIAELLERNEGTFLLKGPWFSDVDMLVTSDPANVHYVTTKNFWNYPKGPESKQLFDFLGNTLFNMDFDEWTSVRKITNSYLKHQQFHRFVNEVIVDNVNKGLIPVLEHVAAQGLVVDLQDLFKRYTYDAAWKITTGYSPNSLSIDFPEVPFINAIDDACEASFNRHLLPGSLWRLKRWLQLGTEKKLSAARKTLHDVAAKYLLMKTEELKKAGEKQFKEDDAETFDALRYCMLNIRELVETTFPAEEVVRDNIISLTFAAYDTSAPTLSWLFWLLSENPHVEAKIKEELHNNFSKKWQLSSKEELRKLVRIIMSGYAIGRMTSVWGDDCLEFRPERWIDEKGTLKYETPAKFFIFNAGPRTCLGKEVALTMLKAAAATIVYNYDIQVAETRLATPKSSIILQMKNGMRVRLKRNA